MAESEVLIGRQPIVDREQRLAAYELLARDLSGCVPTGQGGVVTTGNLLVNAMTEFGLDRLVGPVPAFVNMTREYLVGEVYVPLPPERIVIEVLEDVEPDSETVAGIRHLKQLGFRIAIDDYVGPRAGYEPFLRLADIVKVDCLDRGPLEIGSIVKGLRAYGVQLLAEKVEDAATFRTCRSLGFDLFQGYFFARPDLTRTRVMSVDRANLIHLVARLQDPNASFEDIEEIVALDPALGLKLVRFLNSASHGLAREVGSVREVLLYVGPKNVGSIASMILLSRCDDKPRQLMLTAMQRGRMCQELATRAASPHAQRAFLVGLFSALDAVMDRELSDALASLPLAEDVRGALLQHEGELGRLLDAVLCFERGDWDALMTLGFPAGQLQAASLEAAEWVVKMQRELALFD